MSTLNKLRKCDSIEDLISSFSLKITASQFSYIVYRVQDSDKYHQFTIPKSDGTTRIISSPHKTLKYLQKEFSKIFMQCITEIQQKHPSYLAKNHAFEKYKSIASNASLHKRQKYLLNIDIKDFFFIYSLWENHWISEKR